MIPDLLEERKARAAQAVARRRLAGAQATQRAAGDLLSKLPPELLPPGFAPPGSSQGSSAAPLSLLTDWRVWAGVAALAVVVVVFVLRERA